MEKVDVDELAKEVLSSKLEVYTKINALKVMQTKFRSELDMFEAKILELKDELKKHERQREASTVEITKEVKELKALITHADERFAKQETKNMEKYDKIVQSIDNLTDSLKNIKHDTDDNSKLLMQKRIEEEKQRAVEEAIAERDKPYKEYKKKAIMTVVGVVTLSATAGAWKLIMFVADIDNLVKGVH